MTNSNDSLASLYYILPMQLHLKLFTIIFLCATFVAFGQGRSQTPVWSINLDHSELFFSVSYLTVSQVSGRVHNFRGNIIFDHGQHLPLEIDIIIDAGSIDTANKIRDGHLKSRDFLDVDNFPRITFYSDSIRYLGDSNYLAIGELSIRDETKPLELSFSLSEILEDTWDYKSRFAQFESSFKRTDFGMNWNKSLANNAYLVGDEVLFHGRIQLQPRSTLTPSARHMIPDRGAIRERESRRMVQGDRPEPNLVGGSELGTEEKSEVSPSIVEVVKNDSNETITLASRDIWWWLAYLSLGMIGFMGLFIMAFQGKTYLANLFASTGKEYEETGPYGFLSDVLVLISVFIYAWAMWQLAFSGL